jgi:hypothetical protein
VVNAAHNQMSRLDTAQGFPTGNLEAYVTELGKNKLKKGPFFFRAVQHGCLFVCLSVSACTYKSYSEDSLVTHSASVCTQQLFANYLFL